MKGNPRPTKQPAPHIDKKYMPKGNFHEENRQQRFFDEFMKKKKKKK